MSGVEVVGLLLGAIPLLFPVLDHYKSGLSRIGAGFRKRKHIEKLVRALRLQQQTLVEILKSVLLSSGCGDLPDDQAEFRALLARGDVQEDIMDYLGKENHTAFLDALEECSTSLQQVTKKIAGVVPGLKDSMEIQKIIDANKDSRCGETDFLARVSFAFAFNDINVDIEKIDAAVATLDRFFQRISCNRHLGESQPSRKATKLAKSLRRVREYADHLYVAVAHGWHSACHQQHEAKLFLDDRLDDLLDSASSKRRRSSAPPSVHFRLIFSADVSQDKCLWHETVVHPASGNEMTAGRAVPGMEPPARRVTVVSPLPNQAREQKVEAIKDICSAIEKARQDRQHLIFILTEEKKIAMSLPPSKAFVPCLPTATTTLKEVLEDTSQTPTRNAVLPWKFRMMLALKLASSFLQLLLTPWIETYWSTAAIHFLVSQDNHNKADVSQPCLSLAFDLTPHRQNRARRTAMIREELLELGIVLLEIWHETTLEAQFALTTPPVSHNMRRACALDWLDDVNNPLPDLYHKAVSHCVVRVMDAERIPDWDDTKLWQAICEGIIEPLSKVASI